MVGKLECMNKIFIIYLIIWLTGCSNNKLEEAVKKVLKDPNSAQFQNIKGICGEVNAKNSYGGYTGFKRFYVLNNETVIEDKDNHKDFLLINNIACQSEMSIAETKLKLCLDDSKYIDSLIESKRLGIDVSTVVNIASQNTSGEGFKKLKNLIQGVYSGKFNNGQTYFYKCYKVS